MVIIMKNSSHPPTVGRLMVDCRPTDNRQATNRLPTGYQQITDSRQPEN